MATNSKKSIFKSKKRIKLGIWGLGRGMSFYKTCASLNIDVVAGCDYNPVMRERFLKENPGAYVSDNDKEFLEQDFDAVLLATYCPAHADDAIQCLNAGKHVLSEVTSFHTMAEGVRLVEAVEKSGLVYNLAENYPFTKANMYLADKWKQGLFGELMYAEYEYVHECRTLCYTYIDGEPVIPGSNVHNWRSWLNYHYYNTHSLGPMMIITGLRPTRVTSLPAEQKLEGYPTNSQSALGGIASSLINMSNGAVVRNLMGSTTNDSHTQRLWGTRGAAKADGGLSLRLGAGNKTKMLKVQPQWPAWGNFADTMGHGGGDFWVLYYFARQILEGEPAPFDIYTAADCTIPGILAYRSSCENGKPFDVPNFRNKKERNKYKKDNFAQARYKIDACFPKSADKKKTDQFSSLMKELIDASERCRAALDWVSLAEDVTEPDGGSEILKRFLKDHKNYKPIFNRAKKLSQAYPKSDGARVLKEMINMSDYKLALKPSFITKAKKVQASWQRQARNLSKN
ncbi:MAG: hypothetical protein COA79_18570 [Planctomycetota bacterium]|nr:MAG: hypothetical protein COA79_18570 [Planctomycetota bacterium]